MKHPSSLPLICLSVLCAGFLPAHAQVNSFGLAKTGYYSQDSDSTPVLDAFDNHYFDVWVEDNGQSEIDGATVSRPTGGAIDLLPFLSFFQGFNSQAAMDATFGSGPYTFNVTTVDLDFFFAQLNLPGNNYPTIPQLLNFGSLQSINTNVDLTLRWLPFQGGTAGDFISVAIYGQMDIIYESPYYGEPGALDGTATSVVIPAGSWGSDTEFDCYLAFNRIAVDTSSGAQGLTIFARETYAGMQAAGGAVTVSITGYSVGGNGLFQVQVNGTPGATFTLEGTTGFNGWTTIDSITPPAGTGTLSDPATASNPFRFYRVRAG